MMEHPHPDSILDDITSAFCAKEAVVSHPRRHPEGEVLPPPPPPQMGHHKNLLILLQHFFKCPSGHGMAQPFQSKHILSGAF